MISVQLSSVVTFLYIFSLSRARLKSYSPVQPGAVEAQLMQLEPARRVVGVAGVELVVWAVQ